MTNITELAQSLKAAAEKASDGDWVKESGDGWEAACSANDQANGGFIIAHFEGPDAAENREFVQAANPANIIALVEALEKAQSANEYLREQSAEWERKAISNFEDCAEMSARIEELESQRKLAFAASNRWADKFREAEQRIAELESRTVTAAAAAVLAERKRQVAAEGWTPGHDDEYEHGELADAAGCYALSSELFDCAGEPPRPWPWPDEWWKPTNRRRDLVKAGALILAEIERLDRASGIKVEAQ